MRYSRRVNRWAWGGWLFLFDVVISLLVIRPQPLGGPIVSAVAVQQIALQPRAEVASAITLRFWARTPVQCGWGVWVLLSPEGWTGPSLGCQHMGPRLHGPLHRAASGACAPGRDGTCSF